jgi:hypothetical protein
MLAECLQKKKLPYHKHGYIDHNDVKMLAIGLLAPVMGMLW